MGFIERSGRRLAKMFKIRVNPKDEGLHGLVWFKNAQLMGAGNCFTPRPLAHFVHPRKDSVVGDRRDVEAKGFVEKRDISRVVCLAKEGF